MEEKKPKYCKYCTKKLIHSKTKPKTFCNQKCYYKFKVKTGYFKESIKKYLSNPIKKEERRLYVLKKSNRLCRNRKLTGYPKVRKRCSPEVLKKNKRDYCKEYWSRPENYPRKLKQMRDYKRRKREKEGVTNAIKFLFDEE